MVLSDWEKVSPVHRIHNRENVCGFYISLSHFELFLNLKGQNSKEKKSKNLKHMKEKRRNEDIVWTFKF